MCPPDGKMLYVASDTAGKLTPISLATRKAGTAVSVGTHPVAIVITR